STPSACRIWASTKWPMRALAMTGMVTAEMICSISSGSLMRATPPSRRMSAGTRSSAITATAPASSAILACSGVTTSMMTPPFSISARPRFTRVVPVSRAGAEGVADSVMSAFYGRPGGLLASGAGRRRGRRSCSELAEQGDPLVEGRVGVEQPVEAGQPPLLGGLGRRLLDPQVGGGVAGGPAPLLGGLGRRRLDPQVGGGVAGGVHDGRVVGQLLERRDQPGRVTGQLDRRHVGEDLPPPADRPLHDRGDHRRERQEQE